MSYLEQEIASQPGVINQLLAEGADQVKRIAEAVHKFQPAYVYIAARGTSDNAARYAQYLMGVFNRLPVGLAAPSIHTLYEAPPDLSKALVIGISQSGKSVDVMQVVIDARKQGALTVSITNDARSPMAEAAEYHLPLDAGDELSVAATKTYTAELTAVAMLVAELAQSDEIRAELAKLPQYMAETLALAGDIARWTERYRYINQLVSIGRGFNYCTAFEISLKIKELCYISGHGYSEADFLHGPIAQVQPGFPVVVVAPQGKPFPVMLEFLKKLKERQAEALVISNDESAFATAQQIMRLPELPEWLSPITAVLPGQIFAMNLAMVKGNPVDNPRGLTKVTVTR